MIDPMPFSCSCRRQNSISTVSSEATHCNSGTTSGVMWVDHGLLRGSWRRSCLLRKEERLLYSSHSLFGHLSCRWLQSWHPSTLVVQNLVVQKALVISWWVQSDEQIVSSVFPYFNRCFANFQAGDCSSHLIHGWNLIEACLGNALPELRDLYRQGR